MNIENNGNNFNDISVPVEEYFYLVDALPRAIARMYSNCSDEKVRADLLMHLQEEEVGFGNGGVAHTQLWLNFAKAMGVSEKDVREVDLLPGTKTAVDALMNSCSSGLAAGAAGLYAYESQVPQISVEKIKALKEQYGISSAEGLAFFEVHKIADLKHGALWKAMAMKHGSEDERASVVGVVGSNVVIESSNAVSKALWGMFDSMYEAYVPESERMACGC